MRAGLVPIFTTRNLKSVDIATFRMYFAERGGYEFYTFCIR